MLKACKSIWWRRWGLNVLTFLNQVPSTPCSPNPEEEDFSKSKKEKERGGGGLFFLILYPLSTPYPELKENLSTNKIITYPLGDLLEVPILLDGPYGQIHLIHLLDPIDQPRGIGVG